MTEPASALVMSMYWFQMRHPTTQGLYNYWNFVRGERVAPARLELDPLGLDAFLRDAFILEFIEPTHYRVRIAGARVVSRLGGRLHDTNFLEWWSGNDAALIQQHLSQTVEQGQVTLLTAEGQQPGGGFLRGAAHDQLRTLEIVMLPMTHTGVGIDRILCGLGCLDDDATVPKPVTNLTLGAAQAVWPAGVRQHAQATRVNEPLPFDHGVMGSRLVQQGRRRFRVYEGGLSEAAE